MSPLSVRPSVIVGVFGKKLDKVGGRRWRPSVALAYAPKHVPALARLEEILLVHEASLRIRRTGRRSGH